MSEVQLKSILDNDFYKITMQNAVVKLFPNEKVKYQFINRAKHHFPNGFDAALRRSIDAMAQLQLTSNEKTYLKENCPYIALPYLDFLEGYRYDPSEVTIIQRGNDLEVTVEGLWYRTILWEVPLLALISELHYEMNRMERDSNDEVMQTTLEKAEKLNELEVTFAEFGTRRRHSYQVHDLVVNALIKSKNSKFIGSSNVHFAMKYGVKPIGTHAHEWFMFHAAEFGFKMSNAIALENWSTSTAAISAWHFQIPIPPKFSFSSSIRNLPNCLTVYVTTVVILWSLQIKPLSITKNMALIRFSSTLFSQMGLIWKKWKK